MSDEMNSDDELKPPGCDDNVDNSDGGAVTLCDHIDLTVSSSCADNDLALEPSADEPSQAQLGPVDDGSGSDMSDDDDDDDDAVRLGLGIPGWALRALGSPHLITSMSAEALNAFGSLLQSLVDRQRREPPPQRVLHNLTVDGVADFIKAGRSRNIVVMTGAGISTSAGIPDFRSPGSGLYDNLTGYNLPYPQAVFEIKYFKENPAPFFTLAKALYPGQFKPTSCHYFIRLLNEKGLLLRHFTQNIDTLEIVAGLPLEKVVEAHGSFRIGHCLNPDCKHEYSQGWIRDRIFSDEIPRCTECHDLVKPDIVFFGEPLPERFFNAIPDLARCDLLIIMGTSLVVQPFARLIDSVDRSVPRLLINRNQVGQHEILNMLGMGMNFNPESNYRDVCWLGDCDDGCKKLAELLGWKDELSELIEREWKRIDEQVSLSAKSTAKAVKPEDASEENSLANKDVSGEAISGIPTTTTASANPNSQQQQLRSTAV